MTTMLKFTWLFLFFLIIISFKNLPAGENAFCISDICYTREDCWEDTLWKVSRNGKFLTMLTGSIYETSDTIETSLWLPPADVLICKVIIKTKGRTWEAYEIRNLEEDDEKVLAYKLK